MVSVEFMAPHFFLCFFFPDSKLVVQNDKNKDKLPNFLFAPLVDCGARSTSKMSRTRSPPLSPEQDVAGDKQGK